MSAKTSLQRAGTRIAGMIAGMRFLTQAKPMRGHLDIWEFGNLGFVSRFSLLASRFSRVRGVGRWASARQASARQHVRLQRRTSN